MGEFGTGNKEMDKNQSKNGQSRTREGKSAQKWHAIQRMELMLGSKANIEGPGLEILDAPQGPRSLENGSKLLEDKLELEELMGFRLLIK
ncbi:hypothetical protein Tco_1366273 [Tanacetum coccineum]